MTRRRVFALVFGALIAVFVAGSAVAILAVRGQLIDDVDESLTSEVDASARAINTLDLDDLEALRSPVNERALYLVDSLGAELFFQPAGDVVDPTPPPDLPPSRIIDRSGQAFGVDGTAGGPNYRVAVTRLDTGSYIAIAQPLDDVRSTLRALTRILLLTLLGIVATLGAIFAWLLRRSFAPYDSIVDTAQAIAGGDLDRRAIDPGVGPEVEALTTSMNTMLDRIQTSFEAKDAAEQRVKQFAADASHELRTPISTISGYSELYLSGAATGPDEVAKQMARINSEAGRMGRLVADLLTLTRIDQGHGLDLESIDIRTIVANTVADHQAAEPDTDVALDIGGESALEVLADPDGVQQIVTNLLTNAARHAPDSRVLVDVNSEAGNAVIVVADNGPGMRPDVADKVFDRFFRADDSRASAHTSSGLGLSIVATLVDALGGTIELYTAPGDGARFTVSLPLLEQSTA